jgi:5'-nucleotidase / UDP-sugar diphosphatase
MRKLPLLSTLLSLLVFAVAAPRAFGDDKYTVYREITILHTNDIHSHLLGQGAERDYSPLTTGADGTKGGIARLAALVAKERAENESARNSVLYFDAGDFTMGTVYETIAPSVASELRLLESMGCDATTFGNHEFDWGPVATALIVNAAGGRVPIVATNLVFDASDPGDDALEAMATAGFIKPWIIKTLPNKLRVGIIGLMGRNAAFVVPQAAPVTFRDPVVAATEAVTALKAKGVDVIVCLSHSGVSTIAAASEDEILARLVPGIDVIVSGHTHTLLAQPIVVSHLGTERKTLIVQAGEYGKYLGVLNLRVFNTKPMEMERYRAIPVDDTTRGDSRVNDEITVYTGLASLAIQPLSATAVVAETAFPVGRATFAEFPLGNLVTDAIRATTSAVEVAGGRAPVDFAFESSTQIRDAILPGKTGVIQVGDAFRAFPLGIGPDKLPGWPLLAFFVTAGEVKQVLEVTASLAPLVGEDFFLQVSGLRFTYDPSRAPFNRVVSIDKGDEIQGYAAFDFSAANTALYKVSANLFLSSFIGRLGVLSSGALNIVPKNAAGSPVADLTKLIVDRNPATAALEELKEWQALLGYLGRFPDSNGNGIPDMPLLYAGPLGRIRIVGTSVADVEMDSAPQRR